VEVSSHQDPVIRVVVQGNLAEEVFRGVLVSVLRPDNNLLRKDRQRVEKDLGSDRIHDQTGKPGVKIYPVRDRTPDLSDREIAKIIFRNDRVVGLTEPKFDRTQEPNGKGTG
jgi:hypothetical protein